MVGATPTPGKLSGSRILGDGGLEGDALEVRVCHSKSTKWAPGFAYPKEAGMALREPPESLGMNKGAKGKKGSQNGRLDL